MKIVLEHRTHVQIMYVTVDQERKSKIVLTIVLNAIMELAMDRGKLALDWTTIHKKA